MLITDNDLAVTGATVCGQKFCPEADDSSFAVFGLEHYSCGVTVEKGKARPYLRITPGIQVPKEARAGFERFLFECDDEEMVDFDLDHNDGELVVRRDLRSDSPEDVERALAPTLKWLDEVACPAVMAFIAQTYREADDE